MILSKHRQKYPVLNWGSHFRQHPDCYQKDQGVEIEKMKTTQTLHSTNLSKMTFLFYLGQQ